MNWAVLAVLQTAALARYPQVERVESPAEGTRRAQQQERAHAAQWQDTPAPTTLTRQQRRALARQEAKATAQGEKGGA